MPIVNLKVGKKKRKERKKERNEERKTQQREKEKRKIPSFFFSSANSIVGFSYGNFSKSKNKIQLKL